MRHLIRRAIEIVVAVVGIAAFAGLIWWAINPEGVVETIDGVLGPKVTPLPTLAPDLTEDTPRVLPEECLDEYPLPPPANTAASLSEEVGREPEDVSAFVWWMDDGRLYFVVAYDSDEAEVWAEWGCAVRQPNGGLSRVWWNIEVRGGDLPVRGSPDDSTSQ